MIKNIDLTDEQKENVKRFEEFTKEYIAPHADTFDKEEIIYDSVIKDMVANGMWGVEIPAEYGGIGMDMLNYGFYTEELSKACGNVRNLVGVQGMVSAAVLRWGTPEQKQYWLPKFASGELITAFALTEPSIGSDAKNVQTSAVEDNDSYIITGKKKWITFGERADVFLVFAQSNGRIGAFLVSKNTPGVAVKPIRDLIGFRGSMLGELEFNECKIPKENLIAKVGFGLSHVASHSLMYGRYSTSWGCVGLAQACLEACISYAGSRKQFDTLLKEHQLIQHMIADMVTNIMAARLMSYRVGTLIQRGDRKVSLEISAAKYFASTIAFKIASDAVQIHGANGCSRQYPVERFFRDAKIAEIVEGSTQIQQLFIAKHAFHK
ncbi:MAG: acyl-CoA dehydrogenase [Eubacterium sp.]|jgi:alkylation response protein AidB-like acyl-CoA dehydrogenase|nr:acyl-CoA dehydrogenase [Eubacterium sp.]